MTPEIEAAIKGHPDTITAHGILAREITDLRTRLSEAEDIILAQRLALTGRAEISERKLEGFMDMASSQYNRADFELVRAWRYRAKYRAEIRKREEAERARDAQLAYHKTMPGWTAGEPAAIFMRRLARWYDDGLALPTSEKKSQEKSDGN